MKEFIFTSQKFKGFMRFGFDDQDTLIKFENHATIDDEQTLYLRKNFPFTLGDLLKILGKSGNIEEDIDLTFENFWKRYGYKVGKRNAEIQWRKLDENSKAKAIASIPRYRYHCNLKRIEMVYPERFLLHRRFEDEL